MKKVLIVETNVMRYQGTNDPTGLWLGEAAEFVDEMQRAHIDVDYVSPKGGFVPLDPRSMKYTGAATMAIYETPDFIDRALSHTLTPGQTKPEDYAAIYYTGGHGVMWDFPDNPELQAIASAIYQHGGYVTSVCHGIAGLFNIKDANGQFLIAGKTITGFTATEERLAGKKRVVPFLNRDQAAAHGATFSQHRFYSEYAVTDGRLITGQNPFSVRAVAKQLITKLA